MPVANLQKLNFIFLISFVFAIFETYGLPTSSQMEDDICMAKPDEDMNSDSLNIITDCVKRLGISNTTIIEYNETFAKNDYDDKCLARCVYTGHKLLNEDGEPIRETFINEVKQHFPVKYQEDFLNITNSCITGASSKVEKDGGPTAVPCKFAAMMAYCFVNEGDKYCGNQKMK